MAAKPQTPTTIPATGTPRGQAALGCRIRGKRARRPGRSRSLLFGVRAIGGSTLKRFVIGGSSISIACSERLERDTAPAAPARSFIIAVLGNSTSIARNLVGLARPLLWSIASIARRGRCALDGEKVARIVDVVERAVGAANDRRHAIVLLALSRRVDQLGLLIAHTVPVHAAGRGIAREVHVRGATLLRNEGARLNRGRR